jgi:hypothetical protein
LVVEVISSHSACGITAFCPHDWNTCDRAHHENKAGECATSHLQSARLHLNTSFFIRGKNREMKNLPDRQLLRLTRDDDHH